jgi:hypothetical protein
LLSFCESLTEAAKEVNTISYSENEENNNNTNNNNNEQDENNNQNQNGRFNTEQFIARLKRQDPAFVHGSVCLRLSGSLPLCVVFVSIRCLAVCF